MGLVVYDTLSGKKEAFYPLVEGKVGMYVCGVTVYDLCHLGHARSAVVFDVIRRYLEYKGYQVTYIRNFTDIDDKIINRAKEEGCDTSEITERYINAYRKDFHRLGIRPPDREPKATDHINEMIEVIKILIQKGFAYEREGDIFFSVHHFPQYGKLSRRDLKDLRAGARIEVNEKKDDPLDFALWKKSKPGEPEWKSPWGTGRPGWHIECSVMSQIYLGDTIDLHGGGEDLIFPHHENEIAQSEAATGKPFVRYWLHNGFININREKMSKSLKNFFTVRDILAEHPAESVRYFLLSTHYRSPIDFTPARLQDAKSALDRVYTAFDAIDRIDIPPNTTLEPSCAWLNRITILKRGFEGAMDDDFNTAAALGCIFEFIRETNLIFREGSNEIQKKIDLKKAKETVQELGDILGLFQGEAKAKGIDNLTEDIIKIVIDIRKLSRQNKYWEIADQIRNRLAALNIFLEDQPDGETIWKFKKTKGI